MTGMTATEWRGTDGFSSLVITRDPNGRLSFGVHDTEMPGYTASFSPAIAAVIASFIRGES